MTNKLSDEHAEHLKNIALGGLTRKVTPPEVEEHFFDKGYIFRATGGLMATEAGKQALLQWKKDNS